MILFNVRGTSPDVATATEVGIAPLLVKLKAARVGSGSRQDQVLERSDRVLTICASKGRRSGGPRTNPR